MKAEVRLFEQVGSYHWLTKLQLQLLCVCVYIYISYTTLRSIHTKHLMISQTMASQIPKLFLLFFILNKFIGLSSSVTNQYSVLNPHNLDKLSFEEQALERFHLWEKEEGRHYESPEEEEKRFQIFKKNYEYILQKNAKRSSAHSYRLGLNKFADLSPEEFREIYLHDQPEPLPTINNMMLKQDSCDDAPASLDWREKGVVTQVKNQGPCGSCWAFSAAGAMESINAIVTGDLISLSEQELLDCVYNLGCIGGGWKNKAFEWVRDNGGIDTEANYPYTAEVGFCNAAGSNKVVTIDGYTRVGTSENAVFCATVQQPISVSLNATDFQFYSGGIYDGGNCSNDPNNINHAVVIVGYDSVDGEDYWIVKNSWGQKWGLHGYIFIRRNTDLPYGVCGINSWAYYPTKQSASLSETISSL